MGIAHSPPDKVIHADIDASSSHCLRQGLHQAVQLAGWEIDREITDGFVYILTSQQDISIKCKVKIEDTGRSTYPGFAPVLDITFMDFEEEHASPIYALRHTSHGFANPISRIRAHITPCQIFTYRPGVSSTGYAVMGGIPFLDPNTLAFTEDPCADEDSDLKTTRAWWSCSDMATDLYVWQVPSFRNSWHSGCSATLHNNTFVTEMGISDDAARLRMLPFQRPTRFWEAYGNVNGTYPVLMRWAGTEEPLCLDPLIAWNDTHPVKIRGQLWDAFVRTKYVPWESALAFDSLAWFSYSNGDRQGSPAPHVYSTGDIFTLYLREPGLTRFECDAPPPEPSTESNYAY